MNNDEKLIVPKPGIISLDEVRQAAEKRPAMGIGERGLKRYCSRKEVGEMAAAIAIDVAERTYNLIAKEQAEQLEKLEAMCKQQAEAEVASLAHEVAREVLRLEAELERRTWRDRRRRLGVWVRKQVGRLHMSREEYDGPEALP